jgi:fatty acid kinase
MVPALQETTRQLDVLARNGVVDAGAAGLCVVLEALAVVIGDEIPWAYDVPRDDHPTPEGTWRDTPFPGDHPGGGYEVMYLLDAGENALSGLRVELDRIGDSLIAAGEDGLWNVHVPANDAGAVIEAARYPRGPPPPHPRHVPPPAVSDKYAFIAAE